MRARAGASSFCRKGIVYIRIAHDEEVSATEVHDILQCMNVLCRQRQPLVLVDRNGTYWLSFEAQRVMMEHANFAAIVYWIRRPIGVAMVQHAMSTYFRNRPVRVFRFRSDAIRWLTSLQPTSPKRVRAASAD